MYKMCENCGYFYDDSEHSQCPQCSSGNSEENAMQTQTNSTTEYSETPVSEPDLESREITPMDDEYSGFEFIPSSSSSTNNGSADKTDSDKHKKRKKNRANGEKSSLSNYKKIAAIVLSLILVITGISVIIAVNVKPKIRIDLNDYVVTDVSYIKSLSDSDLDITYFDNYSYGPGLYVYGYNKYAYVNESELKNIIDWERLIDDFNSKLNKKSTRYMTFYDFFDSDSFGFTIDKYNKICNGDELDVLIRPEPNHSRNETSGSNVTSEEESMGIKKFGYSADPVTFTNGKVKIEICPIEVSFAISNLEEGVVIDPFKYVKFIRYGADGYASVGCSVDKDLDEEIPLTNGLRAKYYNDTTIAIEKDDYIITKISFFFDSKTKSTNNYKNGDKVYMQYSCSNDVLEKDYNVLLESNKKEFVFSNLGKFATKSTVINSEDLELLKTEAAKRINDRYGSGSSMSNFKYDSAYIADLKDLSNSSSFHNALYLVYSYTYTSWGGATETRYLYCRFRDLIIDDSGRMKFSPEEYYDNSDSSYESVEEILSKKLGEEYNVTKL